MEAGHTPPGFRPIGYADLLGRLQEGVGQEAFFLGRQSRPAYFELFYWPASEHHFEHWPGKEAPGLMLDTPEKKTPRSLFLEKIIKFNSYKKGKGGKEKKE